jgi:3-isopropylmalate dehydrogenase
MKVRIAFLPGDGIGREVLYEARRVLEAVAQQHHHTFDITEGDIGAVAIDRHGEAFPPVTRELCAASQAVLLGAVGDPKYDHLPPDKRPERGLLALRSFLGNFANLRPVAILESLVNASPLRRETVLGVDLLIVRELLGGIYFGSPRAIEKERAFNTEIYTRDEIRRVASIGFNLARQRRRKLTSVDKANVLESSILWRETCAEVARDFPDVAFSNMYVDNCAMQLVARPQQFDVVLTNNMFGDILSDEASMLAGSLGLLPSASIGGSVGLYEPVHGSAPDIAGQGVANPIGAVASAAMLLDYSLGLRGEAAAVNRAIAGVLNRGYRTRDVKSRESEAARERIVTTAEMGQAICELIRTSDAG